jgi:hypothetical protein
MLRASAISTDKAELVQTWDQGRNLCVELPTHRCTGDQLRQWVNRAAFYASPIVGKYKMHEGSWDRPDTLDNLNMLHGESEGVDTVPDLAG